MKVLALVGMPGSGKSVITEHLQQTRGLPRIYFGDLVLQQVQARGLTINPDNERQVREDMRRVHGMAAMAVLALPAIQAALLQGDVVIDGLYSFSEYRLLRETLGDSLVLMAVAAPRQQRYARLAQRPVRPLTREQAEERDVTEIERIEKGGPIAMADYTVVNDGTVVELLAAVERWLPAILSQA